MMVSAPDKRYVAPMNVPVGIAPATRDRIGSAVIPAGRYKLRVPDYLMLDDAGAFGGQATELVDGDVIVMSPE